MRAWPINCTRTRRYTTTTEFRNLSFSKQVFQDIVLPMTVLEDALDYADRLFGIMPVLIYPCRIFDHGPVIDRHTMRVELIGHFEPCMT